MSISPITFKGSCHLCPHVVFTSDHEMKKHFVGLHKKNGQFCCDVDLCSKKFTNWSKFVRHMCSHYPNHYNVFHCGEDDCNYSSSQQSHVKSHISRIHKKKNSKQQAQSQSQLPHMIENYDTSNNDGNSNKDSSNTALSINTSQHITNSTASKLNAAAVIPHSMHFVNQYSRWHKYESTMTKTLLPKLKTKNCIRNTGNEDYNSHTHGNSTVDSKSNHSHDSSHTSQNLTRNAKHIPRFLSSNFHKNSSMDNNNRVKNTNTNTNRSQPILNHATRQLSNLSVQNLVLGLNLNNIQGNVQVTVIVSYLPLWCQFSFE